MSNINILFLFVPIVMLIGLVGAIFGPHVRFRKRRYGVLVFVFGFLLMFLPVIFPNVFFPEQKQSNTNNNSQQQPTQQQSIQNKIDSQNAQHQQLTAEATIPDPQSNFIGYLEAYLPPEAKGHVIASKRDNGHYLVMCDFDLKDSPVLKTDARQYARDFVFAAYASGMPVDAVTIAMRQPDGRLGLSVTVGAKPASTQPPDTWKNKSIGPSIFIDWVKQGTNLSQDPALRMQASGPFAD